MAPLLDVPIPGTTSRAEDTLPAWMCLTTPEGASSPRNMPQALNRTSWHISQFQLGKPLYQGKTSSLYIAQDKPSRMPVAIKCYHKRRLNTLNMRQVERELLIHLDLKHRNIIKLYAAFEDKRTVYLVLEPAACDVFHKLKQTRVMDEASSWDIVRQCLQACSYLHAKGVIHRDIKPENLLCISASDTIELRLADFGLAIDSRKERPVTRLGTLDFMAPEVLRSPEKRSPEEYKDRSDMAYTTAVDVWAIGVLACELLTGSAPFARKTRLETMDNILRGQLVVPAGVPPKAADFIQAALCKDAKSRFSVEQLLQHTWMKERPAPATAPPPQQVPPGPEPSSRTPEASPGPESKPSTPGSSPGPELMPHTPGASPGPESKPSTPGSSPGPELMPHTPGASPGPESKPSTPGSSPGPELMPHTPGASPGPESKPSTSGTSLGPELVPRTPAIVSEATAPGMVTCTEPATPATPMAPVAPLAAGKSRRLATKVVEPGAAAAAAAAGGATEALYRCSSAESESSAGPRAPSVTSADHEEAQPQPVTSAASATPQNGAAASAAAALAATAASIAAAATTPSNAMRASTVRSSSQSSAGPGLLPTGSKQPAGPSTPQQPVASRPSQPRPNAARGLQGTDVSPSTQAAAVGALARKHAAVQPPTAAALPKAGAAAAPATAVQRQGVPGASSPATTADGISPGHAGQRVNKDAGPGTAQLVPLLAPHLPRPEPNALLCSPGDVQPSCISAPSNTILADTCFLRRDNSWAAKTLASTSASQLFTSPLGSMEMQAPASAATAALGCAPLPQSRVTAAGVQRAAAGGAAPAVPALRLPLQQPLPVTEAAASTATMPGVVGVLGSHQRQGLIPTLGSVTPPSNMATPGAMPSPRPPRPPPAGVLCDEPPSLASPRGAPGPSNKARASLDIGRSAPVVNKESRPWTTTPISRGSTQELTHVGSAPGCTAPAQPPPAASFRSACRRLHVNCNPIGNEALRSSTAVDTPAQGAPNRLCPGLTSSPRVSAAEERRPADTWAVPVVAGPWASAGRQQHQEQQQQQGQQRQGGRQQQLSADESQGGVGDSGAVSPLLHPAEFFGMKLKSFTGKFGPSSDCAAAAPLLPSMAMFAPNTSWLFFKRSKPAAANAVSARTNRGGSAADPPRQQPDNDMSHESRALLDTHTVP